MKVEMQNSRHQIYVCIINILFARRNHFFRVTMYIFTIYSLALFIKLILFVNSLYKNTFKVHLTILQLIYFFIHQSIINLPLFPDLIQETAIFLKAPFVLIVLYLACCCLSWFCSDFASTCTLSCYFIFSCLLFCIFLLLSATLRIIVNAK